MTNKLLGIFTETRESLANLLFQVMLSLLGAVVLLVVLFYGWFVAGGVFVSGVALTWCLCNVVEGENNK